MLKQPVFMVALLWPWIGKHDDELGDCSLVEILPHKLTRITLEDDDVVHAPFFHLVVELSSTTTQYFRADEVVARVLEGILYDEMAVARSDFYDKGVRVAEYNPEVARPFLSTFRRDLV